MDLSGRIVDAWRRWRPSGARFRRIERVASRAALPSRISRRSVVLIAGPQGPKWIVLWCPCGGGHRIELNADARRRPTWQLTEDGRGRPTINPSVDAHGERRCHYWVRAGRVTWVP